MFWLMLGLLKICRADTQGEDHQIGSDSEESIRKKQGPAAEESKEKKCKRTDENAPEQFGFGIKAKSKNYPGEYRQA